MSCLSLSSLYGDLGPDSPPGTHLYTVSLGIMVYPLQSNQRWIGSFNPLSLNRPAGQLLTGFTSMTYPSYTGHPFLAHFPQSMPCYGCLLICCNQLGP